MWVFTASNSSPSRNSLEIKFTLALSHLIYQELLITLPLLNISFTWLSGSPHFWFSYYTSLATPSWSHFPSSYYLPDMLEALKAQTETSLSHILYVHFLGNLSTHMALNTIYMLTTPNLYSQPYQSFEIQTYISTVYLPSSIGRQIGIDKKTS